MLALKIVIGIVIFLFVILFIASYGKVKYEEGFGVGSLCTFYWVENNTTAKDAGQTYIMVSKLHPEDAIYICYRGPDGKLKIPDKAKQLKLDNK